MRTLFFLLFLSLTPFITLASPPDTLPVFMQQLERGLLNSLAEKGIDGNLRIALLGSEADILTSLHHGDAALKDIALNNVNPNNGYFSAAVTLLPTGENKPVTVSLRGQYESFITIPVLKNRVQKGSILQEADFSTLEINKNKLGHDVALHQDELQGKMAIRAILPGKPIPTRLISEPVVIEKGAQVAIIYDTSYIHLRTIGQAMEDGAIGQLISVKNLTSGMVIHATVTGHNEVAALSSQPQEGL